MKPYVALFSLLLAVVLSGCLTTPESDDFTNLDDLLGDAAWITVDILWENYDDLDTAEARIIAVYPFKQDDQISERSDLLIDGLSITLANAFREENIAVNTVNRKNLDDILQELEFQNSDLASPEIQLAVGRQLGAHFIMTGTIFTEDHRDRISFQLLEVETGVILGGFALYLATN